MSLDMSKTFKIHQFTGVPDALRNANLALGEAVQALENAEQAVVTAARAAQQEVEKHSSTKLNSIENINKTVCTITEMKSWVARLSRLSEIIEKQRLQIRQSKQTLNDLC